MFGTPIEEGLVVSMLSRGRVVGGSLGDGLRFGGGKDVTRVRSVKGHGRDENWIAGGTD